MPKNLLLWCLERPFLATLLQMDYVFLECIYYILELFVSVLFECKVHRYGNYACLIKILLYFSILETEIMGGLTFVE